MSLSPPFCACSFDPHGRHPPQPLVTILKAHEFPPTTLKFNPTSKLLVSGSADNSVRVISVPDSLGSSCTLFVLSQVQLNPLLIFSVISLGDSLFDPSYAVYYTFGNRGAKALCLW